LGAPLQNARIDPIVSPGQVSAHAHSIFGGNAFSKKNMTFADTQKSTCTTSLVTVDKSNYWVPKLYLANKNGTITAAKNGGLLVYYLQRMNDNETIVAFPEGFRMISGNPMKRARAYPDNVKDLPEWQTMGEAAQQVALAEQAISWTCFNKAGATGSDDDHTNIYTRKFPDIPCDSFRSEFIFPNCWNGRDLDSADHKSHVAYPDLQ